MASTSLTSFNNSAYPTLTGAGFQGFMNKVLGGITPKVVSTGTVSSNLNATYILDNRGIVWVAGKSDWGRLGNGVAVSPSNQIVFAKMLLPPNIRAVDLVITGNGGTQADAGCIVILEDGTMMSCGTNSTGALGNETVPSNAVSPIPKYVIGFAPENKSN